jgi:hypothetical protein
MIYWFNRRENSFLFKSIWFIYFLVSVNETNDNDDPQKSVTCLSQFVYLPNVIRVEFGSTFDISRWREIELILQYVDILLQTKIYLYIFNPI